MLGIEKNVHVNEAMIKYRELAFQFSVTHNATPADKVHSTSLPIAYLRTEGKTATADALEDLSAEFTTAADATGIFGIFINGEDNIADIDRIVSVEIFTNSAETCVLGADYINLSSSNNIAIDLDSGLNLASASIADYQVIVKYMIK